MYIVTGKTGTPHVSGADDAAFNAAVFGSGMYVIGEKKLTATRIGTGTIQLSACEVLIQGVHARIEGTEEFTVGAGGQGEQRIDSIVAEYTYNSGTGIESVEAKLIQGTPAASNPKPPQMEVSTTKKQMELVRITINTNTISKVSVVATTASSNRDLSTAISSTTAKVNAIPSIWRGKTALMTIPAKGSVSVSVSFGERFAASPAVVATLRGSSGNAKYCTVVVTEESASGATFTLYNTHESAEVKMYVDWIACA